MYCNCFVDQVSFDAAISARLFYGEPDEATWIGDSDMVDEILFTAWNSEPDKTILAEECNEVDEILCNGNCCENDEVIHAELYGGQHEFFFSCDDEDLYDDDGDGRYNVSVDYPWDEDSDEEYDRYYGTYAHDVAGYSDDDIDTIFDGDPDAYWNID